jgi:hypothetical protein
MLHAVKNGVTGTRDVRPKNSLAYSRRHVPSLRLPLYKKEFIHEVETQVTSSLVTQGVQQPRSRTYVKHEWSDD